MSKIDLAQAARRFLVTSDYRAHVSAAQRYLVSYSRTNPRTIAMMAFLSRLNIFYSMGYPFTELNIRYWNVSPVFEKIAGDPSAVVLRLTALNGNRVYTGYRDFTYNRMNLADYMGLLSTAQMTRVFETDNPIDTMHRLIGVQFYDGEAELTVTEGDGFVDYTISVLDDQSFLWYGSGTVRIADIPHMDSFIIHNDLHLTDD